MSTQMQSNISLWIYPKLLARLFCNQKRSKFILRNVTALNLKEFEAELRTKAPVTNDLLDMLCTSSQQKKYQKYQKRRQRGLHPHSSINDALLSLSTACSFIHLNWADCQAFQIRSNGKFISLLTMSISRIK